SRRRHTRWPRDWSSDVCSSDLHPAGIETHVDDHVLDLRQAPTIARVEQKTALGTQGVLAEVALGSASRFAAFDDLVTLAMRAAEDRKSVGKGKRVDQGGGRVVK